MHVSEMVIEVTRRCNMQCDHCLRGEARNANLNVLALRALLCEVESVGSLTLTGGDPSLVPGIIRQVIKEFQTARVSLDYFYMVTNGKLVTDEFLAAIFELYLLSEERDMCRLEMSNDGHHEDIEPDNRTKLSAFSFFGMKNRYDGVRLDDEYKYGHSQLLYEGRVREFCWNSTPLTLNHMDEEEFGSSYVYMNVHGDIYGNCDLSYESQEALKTTNVFDENFSLEKAARRWNEMVDSVENPTVERVIEHLEEHDGKIRIAA